MKDYYQTNKGRLLGIGGILIVVGLILYFARGQQVILVLPLVGIVLFIAGIIYKPRKKATTLGSILHQNNEEYQNHKKEMTRGRCQNE